MTLGTLERSNGASGASFDWYAATVATEPQMLVSGLSAALGASIAGGKPLHGYEVGYSLVKPSGEVAARVLAGGRNGDPHAWASGASAERFADVVRSVWPDKHRVSRMDARLDFGGDGDGDEVWESLYGQCLAVAEEHRLKTSLNGDFLRGVDGRTLYVGSRKSAVYVRLYEKGKQLRGQVLSPQASAAIPANWVRCEVQVRPDGPSKIAAARTSPDEAWGYAKWTKALAASVANLEVPRVPVQVWREADDERALAWMARQYGPTITRMIQADGGDATWARIMRAIEQERRDR